MAVFSATTDRHGCKYGLWLGLTMLATRYIGGKWSRSCVTSATRVVPRSVWCLPMAKCGRMTRPAATGSRATTIDRIYGPRARRERTIKFLWSLTSTVRLLPCRCVIRRSWPVIRLSAPLRRSHIRLSFSFSLPGNTNRRSTNATSSRRISCAFTVKDRCPTARPRLYRPLFATISRKRPPYGTESSDGFHSVWRFF